MRGPAILAGAAVLVAVFAVGGGPLTAGALGFLAFVAVHEMQPDSRT